MPNDKMCDDNSFAACSDSEVQPILNRREGLVKKRSMSKAPRHSIDGTGQKRSQIKVKFQDIKVMRRSLSDGDAESRKKNVLFDMLSNLSTRGSRITRRSTEELSDLGDFSVKPYYNDDSDHSTMLIPPSLQVKESKLTLRFLSDFKKQLGAKIKSDLKMGDKHEEESHMKLERSFIELRFTKSRRLVRICVFCVILIPLFSAAVDDCGFVENQLQISSLRSMCIENTFDVIRRRVVFIAIQLPISLVWFGSTFFKVYTDSLPLLPSIFVLLYGGCSIATTVFGKVPDSGIYMNYLFAVWLFIRIPFYNAFPISWITVISYCVVRIGTFSKVTPGAPATKAVKDMIYLIVMNVVLTYAAYF
jgi:hypothetical protein